jgi:hypothetical protein
MTCPEVGLGEGLAEGGPLLAGVLGAGELLLVGGGVVVVDGLLEGLHAAVTGVDELGDGLGPQR